MPSPRRPRPLRLHHLIFVGVVVATLAVVVVSVGRTDEDLDRLDRPGTPDLERAGAVVAVSWAAPTSSIGPVQSYRVERSRAGRWVPTPQQPAPGVAIGADHTCSLLDEETVKCWGWNGRGELGLGDHRTRGDERGEMGDRLPSVDLPAGRSVVQLVAGDSHSCVLLDDGTVRCWGANLRGELGLGDNDDRGDDPGEMGDHLPAVDLGQGRRAVSISAGAHHTCALLDDGSARCWGANQHGQLGLGDTNARGDGPGEMGDHLPAVDVGDGRLVGISAGRWHTCGLFADGAVACWGSGRHGALGSGDTEDRGDEPGEMGAALPRVDLGPGRRAEQLATGGSHTCVISGRDLLCWGLNSHGQLGLGDRADRGDDPGEMGARLAPVSLGHRRAARSVTVGLYATCVLLDEDTSACWGDNAHGSLGLGDRNDRGDEPGEMGDALRTFPHDTPGPAQVITGYAYTCEIDAVADLRCRGLDFDGELGQGSIADLGDQPAEVGDELPAVLLGKGRHVSPQRQVLVPVRPGVLQVRVRAIGSTGSGPVSEPSRRSTTPAPAPSAPRAPIVASVTPLDGGLTVHWVAPLGDGGRPISGYTVRVVPGDGGDPVIRQVGRRARQLIVRGLRNGVPYRATIVASNRIGASLPGSSGTSTVPGTPAPPTDVRARVAPDPSTPGGRLLQVRFEPGSVPADAPIASFAVVCASSPGDRVLIGGGATPSVDIELRGAPKTRTCSVVATNRYGAGPRSEASPPVIA